MDSAEGPSAELVVRSTDTVAFGQSGQLDWVGFLRGTAEASISILTRLSGSGVEPLTVLVAQKVCSPLRLSAEGHDKVTSALSTLKSFSSFGDVLWFGFGVRHLIRSLSTTREGLSCVSLCAALAVTHSPEVAARTLSSLADLNGAPRELSPSIAQWTRLVQTCSGCLAQSNFGDVVLGFTRPGRLDNPSSFPATWHRHNSFFESSDPRALAEALRYLAMVSSGRLESIEFNGGLDCGWIGAVAYWLLGLSVSIAVGGDPAVFYNGTGQHASTEAQIKIVYDRNCGNSSETASLVMKKSHKLGGLSELIKEQLDPDSRGLRVQVPWETALTETFGSKPLSILVESLSTQFLTAVGSAASLFESVAMARSDVDPSSLLQMNRDYLPGTYGRGFVHTLWSRFPELPRTQQGQALDYLEPRFQEARMSYERAIQQLTSTCECRRHGNGKALVCIVAFLETILYIARASPSLIVDKRVRPSMNGIYGIYEMMVMRRKLSPFEMLFKTESSLDISSLGRATRIFRGTAPSTIRQGQSEAIAATVESGLCYYVDSLRSLSDSPEHLARVHIVPGCIQLENRTFMEVRDSAFKGPKYRATTPTFITSLSHPSSTLKDDLKVEAVATEAESYASFGWKITMPQQSEASWLPPARLAEAAANFQGRVSCASRGCQKMDNIPELLAITGSGAYDPLYGKHVRTIRFVPKAAPGWCVSLMSAVFGEYTFVVPGWAYSAVLLQTTECLDCCAKALLKVTHGERNGELIYRV
ncbi:hypothetical protein GGR56DRAFT_525423 [Xylariaceae sp. FL0804]|nr:hypothetical protein GGR56DRAFT_525423 [Xylariaceae sp. FL0804]